MAFALGTSAGAGTITIVAGGTIVTGVSTNFVAANVGAILVVGAQWGVIATVTSTTSITIDRPFTTAVTASAYQISANIPIITQTGTDTSLSTLTGVPGVTTSPATSPTLWTITSACLVINGSLTINRLTNRLRFLNPASVTTASTTVAAMSLGTTGVFNNSTSQSSGGYTYRSPSYSILFDVNIPTVSSANAILIFTNTGSSITLEGNIEFTNTPTLAVLVFSFNGVVTLQYGAMINSNSGSGNNYLFVAPIAATNMTITSFSTYGISLRIADNTTTINNYAAVAGVNAININTINPINNVQYFGLQDLGNTTAIRTAAASLKYFQLVNLSSTTIAPGFSAGSNTGSQFLIVNQLVLSASGASGAIQNVKFWARDSNNGARYSANYGAGQAYEIATTGDLTYTATTAASGIAPTLNVISAVYYQPTSSTFAIDYRGNNGARDLNIYQCAYNYVLSNSLTALWPLNAGVYGGTAARNQGFVLLTDTSITQATMATVAAYTALDTAQQLYDYAKYYLYTNFAGQTATYVARSGNIIDAGSYNIIIDATAATPFVFAGSTITAKSSTFTGSLTTSGAVTLANGSVFSNNSVTANVSQATPTNLTGVTITGNLTYNTNTPITITLTNCAVSGTVSNSGSGLVTINLTDSTIGVAGSNIAARVTTSLNINGLTAGSQIYVADGTGTQIAYISSSSTSYTLNTTGGTGTYTYKVARYGYTAQTGTHSPATASTTVTITLIADAFITQPTAATVAAYTSLGNPDQIYDYAAYWETTNAGIPTARVASKIASQVGLGSYNVTFNSAAGSVWSVAAGLVTTKTASFAPGVTMTGGLYTTGNVIVNSGTTVTAGITAASITNAGAISSALIGGVTNTGTINNSTITGNVSQAIPTDLTGTTITGNFTYNTNSAIEITYTSSAISGTVSNSGTATVTINLLTSTIGTVGARINSRQQSILTINGLTAGSQIYVANGSGTQVAYVASSGTSYALTTSGQTGTWSYKVARYGYTAQTGSHFPAVGSTTVTITLNADLFVTQANKATVAAYTVLDNNDKLYDYSAYYETTNAGIPYARVITKAGTSPSAGSYPVTINDTADLFVFDGSSLSIWTNYTLSPGTTITGPLFTSGVVTIPTGFNNASITANVSQLVPSDMSGVTITGNLTYNESAPFLFSITMTNCIITGTISNSGTADVLITKVNTTIGTLGARVTAQQFATVSAPNLLTGTRVRVLNTTNNIELYNDVLASAGFSQAFIYTGNKNITLTATYVSGVTAKLGVSASGILTAGGATFLNAQVDDTVYNGYGIDGSTVTGFTPDYVNDDVNLSMAGDFMGADLYAWWVYNEATEDGIRNFFGGITALDAGNLRINATTVSLFLDNSTANFIYQNDSIRIFRSDNIYPARTITTGGGGIAVNWQSNVYVGEAPDGLTIPTFLALQNP